MSQNGHISRVQLQDAFGGFNEEIDIDALFAFINDDGMRVQDMIRAVNHILHGHGIRHIDTVGETLSVIDMGDDYVASMSFDQWGKAQILCVADLYPTMHEDGFLLGD